MATKFDLLSRFQTHGHGEKRSALYRLAIISSGVSKVFGLALQALAVPLIFRSLGELHYNLYTALTAILSTIVLVQMGAGPGLTKGIARANAIGNREQEAALMRAAFRLAAGAALIGCSVLLAVVHQVPIGTLFNDTFVPYSDEIIATTDLCVMLLAIQVLAGVVDSALAGYQEQVYTNLAAMLANIASLVLLIIVCSGQPTIFQIVMVVFGVPTFFRILNLGFLAARRTYLLSNFFGSASGSYKVLLMVGLGFWGIEAASVMEQMTGNQVLIHLSSGPETAIFNAIFKYVGLAGSVATMVTLPLWPAFTDAIVHRDITWISRSLRRLRTWLMAYACAIALGLAILGPWLLHVVVGINTEGRFWLFLVFGLYFIALIWGHLHHVTLMGIASLWQLALVLVVENIVMLLLGLVLVPRFGAVGMALSYLIAILALPAWLLPRMLRNALQRIAGTPAMP
ncbi:MAG: hypothetical protein ABIQ86_10690 [Steroidobacteraceae bacterium]